MPSNTLAKLPQITKLIKLTKTKKAHNLSAVYSKCAAFPQLLKIFPKTKLFFTKNPNFVRLQRTLLFL